MELQLLKDPKDTTVACNSILNHDSEGQHEHSSTNINHMPFKLIRFPL